MIIADSHLETTLCHWANLQNLTGRQRNTRHTIDNLYIRKVLQLCQWRVITEIALFSPGTCEASRGASKSAFSRHMVWLSQWKFPVKSRWSGAGYLLHITTTAVQHNRDDMSVLCLINKGHKGTLTIQHSADGRFLRCRDHPPCCRGPLRHLLHLPRRFLLRHGFEHVGCPIATYRHKLMITKWCLEEFTYF